MNRVKNIFLSFFKTVFSLEGILFFLYAVFLYSIYELVNKFWFGVIVFVLLFTFSLFSSFLRKKRIESAISFIENRLEKLGGGDFNLLINSFKDEQESLVNIKKNLLSLTSKFENIISTIRVISSNIKENSYKIDDQLVVNIFDVRSQIENIEVSEKLGEEVEILIEKMNQDVKTLIENTDRTVQFLENIFNQNEDIKVMVESLSMYVFENKEAMNKILKNTSRVTEYTENLSALSLETFSSITEMESTFKEIEKYINFTEKLTKDIITIAKSGLDQSKATLQSVEKVNDVFNEFVIKINVLKEQSKKIERIVNAISKIGERTNLLALNASIISQEYEGDTGDFEIITQKIRELSESSSLALKEVSELIVNFENIISELGEILKEGSVAVDSAIKNVYSSSENFGDITNRLGEIGQHFYNLATSSNEHAQGTQQVREAAHQISNLSEEIANLMSAEEKIVNFVNTKTTFVAEMVEEVNNSIDIQAEKVQNLLSELKAVEDATRRLLRQSDEMKLNNSISMDSIRRIKTGLHKNFKNILTMSNISINLKKYSEFLNETIDFFRLPYRFHGGTLKAGGLTLPFDTLDPITAENVAEIQLLDLIYSKLVKLDYLNDIVPDLCTHWEMSDDGLEYVFYLRKGVVFHNGQRFTATDVLTTFKRILNPHGNCAKRGLFFVIKGAREFNEGKTEVLEGIKIIDDFTVKFILEKPLVFFLSLLTLSQCSITPQSEFYSDKKGLTLVGTGPFKIEFFNPREKLVLKKNENYYVQNRPFVSKVVVDFENAAPKRAIELFEKGELDIVFATDQEYLKNLKDKPELEEYVIAKPGISTFFLSFNCEKKPFDNPKIRFAISLAIDRAKIIDKMGENYAVPTYSIVPQNFPGYSSSQVILAYDEKRAYEILKKEGYDFNSEFEITFRQKGSEIPPDILVIRECLEKIGIKTVLNGMSNHWEYVRKKKHTAFRVGWVADYVDPDNFFFSLFNSKGGDPFYTSYYNAEIDRLTEQARFELEPRTRGKFYRTIEEIVLQDAPVIPLYNRKNIMFANTNLQGVKLKPSSPSIDFGEISFRTFS